MAPLATFTEPMSDYQALLGLEPCELPEIAEYVQEHELPVFVGSDLAVYFCLPQEAESATFRRLMQGLVERVHGHSGECVALHRMSNAAFESFKSMDRSPEPKTTGEESNEKVEELLTTVVQRNASDLHIKLDERLDRCEIRLRINGELTSFGTLSHGIGDALLRSLWINYSNIDRKENAINNGSFYFRPQQQPHKEYMVRLTESPESRGTMFVARVRDPHEIRALENIGYNQQQEQVILNLLSQRRGLASINGPTNSGKSSTQSAMLALIPPSKHIVEIGDPVETYQDHIAHFELRDSYPGGKDKHLEELLGATVRQDPDILALTEMRDTLTAKAALQLASQGKFVVTTMHTNDFVSSFERLQRMGLSRADILAPGFLRGLVSQKLLPRLCTCSRPFDPTLDSSRRYVRVLGGDSTNIRLRNKSGCPACHHTGIIDRVLVAEAVEIHSEVSPIIRSILECSDPTPYFDYARQSGILNIHQHARERVLAGEVDPAMAEAELGKFSKENLLWLCADEGASI